MAMPEFGCKTTRWAFPQARVLTVRIISRVVSKNGEGFSTYGPLAPALRGEGEGEGIHSTVKSTEVSMQTKQNDLNASKPDRRFDGPLVAFATVMFLAAFAVTMWFETTYYFGKDHVGTWLSFMLFFGAILSPFAAGLAVAGGRILGVRLSYVLITIATAATCVFSSFCVVSPDASFRNQFGNSLRPDARVIDYIEYPTFGHGTTQLWIIRPVDSLPEAFISQHNLVQFDRSNQIERVQDMFHSHLKLSNEAIGWYGPRLEVVFDAASSTAVIVKSPPPRQR